MWISVFHFFLKWRKHSQHRMDKTQAIHSVFIKPRVLKSGRTLCNALRVFRHCALIVDSLRRITLLENKVSVGPVGLNQNTPAIPREVLMVSGWQCKVGGALRIHTAALT